MKNSTGNFLYDHQESHLNALERAVYKLSKTEFEGAFRAFLNLAEIGIGYAQYRVGWMYAHGIGVEADDASSSHWYKKCVATLRKLAKKEDVFSQFLLGQLCIDGAAPSIISLREAITWTRKAADQGFPDAQYNMAGFVAGSTIKGSHIDWLRKAAENGQSNAQRDIAVYYAVGECIQKDLKLAASWYDKAAQNGNVRAQYDLGLMFIEGEGVEQDIEKGMNLLRKAADSGEPASKKYLENAKPA